MGFARFEGGWEFFDVLCLNDLRDEFYDMMEFHGA